MAIYSERTGMVLSWTLALLVGSGLAYGLYKQTHQPPLNSVQPRRLALLDLTSLDHHTLQHLTLGDVKDNGLRVLGLNDLKDRRIRSIHLSDLRPEYLHRIPLDQLRDKTLASLSTGDVHNSSWLTTPELPALLRSPQVAEGTKPIAVPQHASTYKPVPLHVEHPVTAYDSAPTPTLPARLPYHPSPAVAYHPAPRVVHRYTPPKRYIAARPTKRRYIATRTYPTPRRSVAIERDVAFGNGAIIIDGSGRAYKVKKIKVFARKMKSFFRNIFD